MNIFLPYPYDIEKSVQSLDNLRLNKQIIECKTLLECAIAYQNGTKPNSYFKHPVAQFYKDNPQFIAYYGYECCLEYQYRFSKIHQDKEYFCDNEIWEVCPDEKGFIEPDYTPYYMELSKDNPNNIRTTIKVGELFTAKLIKKWLNDKKEPNWGRRCAPFFWSNYMKLKETYKQDYWEHIEKLKQDIIAADKQRLSWPIYNEFIK